MNVQTSFIIKARDTECQDRTKGGDEFVVVIKCVEDGRREKVGGKRAPGRAPLNGLRAPC